MLERPPPGYLAVVEPDRRRLIARTALRVLADAGARGLTHRAVDAAADLPAGSTSYYLRSRAALLQACVEHLVAQDHADLDVLAPVLRAADANALGAALGDVLHRWLTTDRHRHLARYELSLESVRRPDLAEVLHHAGAALRLRIADVLADLGVPEPVEQAHWLVACVDGILFDRIAGANAGADVDRGEVRRVARRLVDVAVAPATGSLPA